MERLQFALKKSVFVTFLLKTVITVSCRNPESSAFRMNGKKCLPINNHRPSKAVTPVPKKSCNLFLPIPQICDDRKTSEQKNFLRQN
jgi:hypothetical protein